jgi:hypothetical protein
MLRAVLGEMVQTTDGKWMTRPPTSCPNGHQLGPNQVLVGRTCDAVVYGPALNKHCTALEGPATVRIFQ